MGTSLPATCDTAIDCSAVPQLPNSAWISVKEILPSRRFVPAGSSCTVTEIVPLPRPFIGSTVAHSNDEVTTFHSQLAVICTVCVFSVASVNTSDWVETLNVGVADLLSSSLQPVNTVAATRNRAPNSNLKRCLFIKVLIRVLN